MQHDPDSLDQSVYMTTYTGIKFTLFEPKGEDVSITDIAHALSMLCRFTGHCQRFYSVAQHCVHVSHLVAPEHALEGLLHDASEAYINDLNRPMKHHPQMSGYRDAELVLDLVIRRKFGLPLSESADVKDADDQIVCSEARQLLRPVPSWAEKREAISGWLPVWDPAAAETQFIYRYQSLTNDYRPA